MYTYEEKLRYELNKMDDRDSQKRFFGGAINRMKFGTDANKVYEQKEFACDVLCHCGFCMYVDCDKCALEANYRKAIEEIATGMRSGKLFRNWVSYKNCRQN